MNLKDQFTWASFETVLTSFLVSFITKNVLENSANFTFPVFTNFFFLIQINGKSLENNRLKRNIIYKNVQGYLKQIRSSNPHRFWSLGFVIVEKSWVRLNPIQSRCSVKEVFLQILQNSQEGTSATVCFLVKPASLLKKRLWHRSFPANSTEFLRTPFL